MTRSLIGGPQAFSKLAVFKNARLILALFTIFWVLEARALTLTFSTPYGQAKLTYDETSSDLDAAFSAGLWGYYGEGTFSIGTVAHYTGSILVFTNFSDPTAHSSLLFQRWGGGETPIVLPDLGPDYTVGYMPPGAPPLFGLEPTMNVALELNYNSNAVPQSMADIVGGAFSGSTISSYYWYYSGPLPEPNFDGPLGCCSRGLIHDVRNYDGVLEPTPVPGALPLFAGGLCVVAFLARRRKRATS